jgi:hypothetical protein
MMWLAPANFQLSTFNFSRDDVMIKVDENG